MLLMHLCLYCFIEVFDDQVLVQPMLAKFFDLVIVSLVYSTTSCYL